MPPFAICEGLPSGINPATLDFEESLDIQWLCWCDNKQDAFCPYCEHDRAKQPLEFTGSRLRTPLGDGSSRTQSGRPQKLRKVRSDYKQLQYEALSAEAILFSRPQSLLWKHSQPPQLAVDMRSGPDYIPSAPIPRSPKKLEKKHRAQKPRLTPNTSTSSSEVSSGSRSSIRIVKSKSFQNPRNRAPASPRPRPLSGSFDTTALVSLAWTGEVISSLKASEVILPTPDNTSSQYSSSTLFSLNKLSVVNNEDRPEMRVESPPFSSHNSSIKRPVLRKPSEGNLPRSPTRRWTLAMAIIDDNITDEKLVDDLENMRIKEKQPDSIIPDPYPLPLCLPPSYYDSLKEYPFEEEVVQLEDDVDALSNSSWNTARRALLLCRELVQTERRYLSSLKTLITSGTSTQPPSSMLSYLPGLIAASEMLLCMMEENPSVQGVSQAFIACQEKLAQSFVDWCGVVGRFFDLEKDRTNEKLEEGTVFFSQRQRQPRSSVSARVSLTKNGLPIVVPEPNKIRRNNKARPSVRDLAILPTQRITRYVLLLKELRSLTPPTLSSFAFVDNAVRSAESIATAANEARGHSALIPCASL